jgi:hypothetical protein
MDLRNSDHHDYHDYHDYFSKWERLKQGVPQGLVLGPKFAKVFVFADDTSILITGKYHSGLKHKVMGTLSLTGKLVYS